MDSDVDNMLKQETNNSNEPVKKVIEYLTIQTFFYNMSLAS